MLHASGDREPCCLLVPHLGDPGSQLRCHWKDEWKMCPGEMQTLYWPPFTACKPTFRTFVLIVVVIIIIVVLWGRTTSTASTQARYTTKTTSTVTSPILNISVTKKRISYYYFAPRWRRSRPIADATNSWGCSWTCPIRWQGFRCITTKGTPNTGWVVSTVRHFKSSSSSSRWGERETRLHGCHMTTEIR